MSWWTEARDTATGRAAYDAFQGSYNDDGGNFGSGLAAAWHSSPVTKQFLDAPWHLVNNPREIAPSYVLSHDYATPLDTAALGAPAQSRAVRNTGRIGGLGAAAWGLGVAAGAGFGAEGEAGALGDTSSSILGPGYTAEGEGGNAAYFGASPGGGTEAGALGTASLDPEMAGLTEAVAPGGGSSMFPSWASIRGGLGVASTGYGLYQAEAARRQRAYQVRRQREYQNQLNELMSNPGSVTSLPGYKFRQQQGEEALARRMASLGYGGRSGNLGTALTKYGQDYATGELQRQEGLLAQLYGMSGPDTNARDPFAMAMGTLGDLGYGVGYGRRA